MRRVFYSYSGKSRPFEMIKKLSERRFSMAPSLCVFVFKRSPSRCIRHTHEGRGGVLFMRSQFPTPRARWAFTPSVAKTEGHTKQCSRLGYLEWVAMEYHPAQVQPWSADQWLLKGHGFVYGWYVWKCYYIFRVPIQCVDDGLVVQDVKSCLLEAGAFIE